MKITEMTIQVRVTDFEAGKHFYQALSQRDPDFIPHEGFAEWEFLPKCWIQVAEGEPAHGSGPLRFGVTDIEKERLRVATELGIQVGEIFSRLEVPVKWCTFEDLWGNRLGFFEEIK
ncbi:MAG: VOC family protein [Alicyclobacillus sp.]|nr:VOC family protein [Alicyclobacillus sp.]